MNPPNQPAPDQKGTTAPRRTSALENDNVFGDDDAVHQLATVTGDMSGGDVAALTVGVSRRVTGRPVALG